MRVTVTETIEHSADVTPEMVVAYLERNGWTINYRGNVFRSWCLQPGSYSVTLHIDRGYDDADDVVAAVDNIARHEKRKPHEVLYDIARMK